MSRDAECDRVRIEPVDEALRVHQEVEHRALVQCVQRLRQVHLAGVHHPLVIDRGVHPSRQLVVEARTGEELLEDGCRLGIEPAVDVGHQEEPDAVRVLRRDAEQAVEQGVDVHRRGEVVDELAGNDHGFDGTHGQAVLGAGIDHGVGSEVDGHSAMKDMRQTGLDVVEHGGLVSS